MSASDTKTSKNDKPVASVEPIAVDIEPSKLQKTGKKKSLWRRIGFALLFLLIILLIGLWAVWVNRNLVVEQALQRVLAARGYDARFTIDELTDTQAVIRDVIIKHEGETFASAKRLDVDYVWPDVKTGALTRLEAEGLTLIAKIDEGGAVVSDWMPPPSGEQGAGLSFPSQGVFLSDANIDLSTPWGEMDIAANIDAPAIDAVSFRAQLAPSDIAYDRYKARLEGVLSGQLDGDRLDVSSAEFTARRFTSGDINIAVIDFDSQGVLSGINALIEGGDIDVDYSGLSSVVLSELSGKNVLSIKTANLELNGTAMMNEASAAAFNGQADLQAHQLVHQDGAAGMISAGYEGQLSYGDSLSLSGDLDFTANDAALSDSQRALSVSKSVTLYDTLSRVPVAQNFHASFTQTLTQILSGANWDGSLSVESSVNGYELGLLAPLRAAALGSKRAGLTLSPSQNTPLIRYDRSAAALALKANLTLSGSRNLSVRGLTVDGASDTGLRWSNIEAVSATIGSDDEWQSEDARLGPFDAKLDFKKARSGHSGINIDLGGLDYDGALIGSMFMGLKTGGQLRVENTSARSVIYFTPSGPITADSVASTQGWTARGLTLELSGGAPLMTRDLRKGSSSIDVAATKFSAKLIKDETGQDMELSAARADIKGATGVGPERWDVSLSDGLLESQNLPGPDTIVRAARMDMSFSRAPESNWIYKLSSPSLNANVSPLRLRGTQLGLEGSQGDFTADYSGGTAQMDNIDLPALPMTGRAVYEDGYLSGTAQTAMPRSPGYPIYATYDYKDGRGGAVLDIPEFLFSQNTIQPQDLAPVLRGKIAAVEGKASANVTLSYKAGTPLGSRGTITLTDMDIGTLAGPFTGVNTTLNFDSLLPLRSLGTQTITMTGFNAGLPLGAGTIRFDVIEGGVKIHDATWPLGSGRVFVEPVIWKTTGEPNRLTVNVSDIELSEILAQLGNEDISATGKVDGVLPVVFDGVKVSVDQGRLEVKDGGVIRVRTAGLDAAAQKNDTAKMAIDALKAFEYEALSLDVDGPLDGDIVVGAIFRGKNKDVLGGSEFLFRVNIAGELVNIARSLGRNAQVEELIRALESERR